jgi:hypothetical protein
MESSRRHPRTPNRVEARAAPAVLAPVTKARLLFLGAAGISLLTSVFLWFTGNRDQALFVGLWVPTVLSAGALVTSGSARRE